MKTIRGDGWRAPTDTATIAAQLAELHRDAFVIDKAKRSTVDLAGHRRDSSLDDLDLDVDEATASRAV